MHFHPLTDEHRAAWDAAVAARAPDGGLLQSWAWGEFQRAEGRPVVRLGGTDADGRFVAGWQLIRHRLPLGRAYCYAPRALLPDQPEAARDLLAAVRAAALAQAAVFVRVDLAPRADLAAYGFRRRPHSTQPDQELIVDLRPSEAELLAAMKPKTRYNIRLAERHGVVVEHHGGRSALGHIAQDCYRLIALTARRQGIRPHPERYYRGMVAGLGDAGLLEVAVARRQGEALAAALVVTFGSVATYLHGGSADVGGELMAPHLLHWRAMRRARARGCRAYNFGGVSPDRAAWAGLTRFKQGFAPDRAFVTYGGGWELPVRRMEYAAYQSIRMLRHSPSGRGRNDQ